MIRCFGLLLGRADHSDVAAEVKVVVVECGNDCCRNRAARRVQRVPGVACPAVSCEPAAICETLLPARSSTLPTWVATIVLPHSVSIVKASACVLSATTEPSLVLTVVLMP